jgi:hypothetical protein
MSNDRTSHPYRLRIAHEQRVVVPAKLKRQEKHFVKLPMTWVRRLKGASGQTWMVAAHVLYLNFKGMGEPIKLANGMLKIDGVPPQSKTRALRDLERRGLIAVERQPRKSPIVRLVA